MNLGSGCHFNFSPFFSKKVTRLLHLWQQCKLQGGGDGGGGGSSRGVGGDAVGVAVVVVVVVAALVVVVVVVAVAAVVGVVVVDHVWNVMVYVQKPDFVFRRDRWVHLKRWGRQFSRLLAAEVCASAVVMLDTWCSEVVWEYWLPTPFTSFPFTFPPVRHHVPSHFNWTLITLQEGAIYQKRKRFFLKVGVEVESSHIFWEFWCLVTL